MVSAIITTHNRVDLLIKAIESVKSQTYKNIEIIVVDDASNDSTQEMCSQISGINYIRIPKEESKGGNHARNVGIINAIGKYVAFLDDDDQWYSDKIEKQMVEMKKSDNIGMVYTGSYIDTGIKFFDYSVLYSKDAQGNLVEKKAFWKPICPTSSMMIKKDILIDIGMFDENVNYWQEYELSLRVIQKCEVALVNQPLVLYRNHIKDTKKLTNNYGKWEKSVKYIYSKHEKLFDILDDNSKVLQEEYYYKEGAYRCSAVGDKNLMRQFYRKAYNLTHKIEYLIRYKMGLSRQDTIYLENIIKKFYYKIKR